MRLAGLIWGAPHTAEESSPDALRWSLLGLQLPPLRKAAANYVGRIGTPGILRFSEHDRKESLRRTQ